jgi:uncharacterized RDD family membrane protein YckC
MGRRFFAFLVDWVFFTPIAIALYAIAAAAHLSVSKIGEYAVGWLALSAYSIPSLLYWRTTLGKYLFGLEVKSLRPEGGRLRFLQVLDRETLGRFLSCLLFGVGYWRAIRDPKKQAWSDRLAWTVVVRRKTRRGLRIAIGTLALVLFAGLLWSFGQVARARRFSSYATQLSESGEEAARLRKIIDTAFKSRVSAPAEMRLRMTNLDSTFVRLETNLKHCEALIQESAAVAPDDEARRMVAQAKRQNALLQQEIAKQREATALIATQLGDGGASPELMERLGSLDSEINDLQKQINELPSRASPTK